MSLRRLRVLVENLPVDSATARAVRDDPWGPTEHLLADVFDVIAQSSTSLLRAQGAKPRKPKAHPRPGDRDKDSNRIGSLGKHSQEQALAFIQSRKPRTPPRVPAG